MSDEWSSLHDATLISVGFEWSRATIEIVLHKQPEGRVVIVGTEAVGLTCDRQLPWGPSASINEVRCSSAKSTKWIEIEMQSGDTIRAQARDFFMTAVTQVPGA